MIRQQVLIVALGMVSACTVFGQFGRGGQSSSIQARITGSNNGTNGKCTIEVNVDGSAQVEIRGDRAVLRTLSGQPARFVRMDCNSAMPSNMSDFKFRGIDGRGRQNLVTDPRGGRGVAVVQIDDPNNGSEGYTFDVEWSGGSYNSNNGGYRNDDRYNRGNDRGGRYDNNRGGNSGGRWSNAEAIRSCQDSVRDRIRSNYGAQSVDFGRVNMDDKPGRNDYVVGTATARSGRRDERYEFSCSVDFNSGRVRDVNVNRR